MLLSVAVTTMMMKTRISDEAGLLLSVVIPIAQTRSSTFQSREGAWLEDDNRSENHSTYYKYADLDVQEDSECTEEEKVAVEQLTELRRIRDLSMQENANDCSCSTEGSFNTYEGRLPLLLASSHTCTKGDPSTSPAASSSAACIFDFLKLKHKQEQQKYELQSQQTQDVLENIEDNMVDIQVTTNKHVTPLSSHEFMCDGDGRTRPRSRLLSDIYRNDHLGISSIHCDDHLGISSFSQNSKALRKRRKAISKIMAVGQQKGVAMTGGKLQCTHTVE